MIRPAAALLSAAIGFAAFPAAALAATLKVPSEAYPTIQSAVDAAGAGDVILVAKGTYHENIAISGSTPFTLKGKGKPVIDGGGGTCISLVNAEGVTVTGFVLSNANEGVYASNCTGIVLEKLSIPAPSNRGMLLRYGGSPCTVSKCSVSDSDEEGILDVESTGLVVTKCAFTNTGQAAVALSPNYFTDDSAGSDDAVVSKNRITGAGGNGIHFGGNGVLVSKNTVVSASGTGIYDDFNTPTTGALVEKNKVTGAADHGIYISGSGNTVSKNKVTGGAGAGLYVDGDGQAIEKNSIRGTAQNGIEVRGSGGHSITKNKVAAAANEGILVVSDGDTLTGNKASGSGDYDLYDENPSGVNTYDGNRFGSEFFGGV